MNRIKVLFKKIPWITIPIVIVMGFIPLVVYYHSFKAQLSQMSWYSSNDYTSDLFNYHKSQMLFFIGICILLIIIVAACTGTKLKFHKCMFGLSLYALMIIVSTLFTEYSYYSLNGITDHFETVYVLLTYCLLVYFSYLFVDSEKNIKFIIYCWLVGIALMSIIGIFQLCGHDLYKMEFFKNLLLPKDLEDTLNLNFVFEKGRVYLTVFNPNYVGFYATLTIPILTALFVFSQNRIIKIISIVLNSFVFLCLMGSGARNGVIALCVAMALMLIFIRKSFKTHCWYIITAYVSMIAIFVIFNIFNENALADRLEAGLTINEDAPKLLTDIQTNDDNVTIIYNNETLVIKQSVDKDGHTSLSLSDDAGAPITIQVLDSENNTYKIADERYPFTFVIGQVGNYAGFAIDIDEQRWGFTNQTGHPGYYYYSPYGRITKIEKADSAIFTNHTSIFSNRGYLWSRTIPLLKDYFFIGSGPDTFTLVFPQKDYVAAAQSGFSGYIVTKPHNLYLQIGTQTGVISLIGYLAFNIIYLLECFKLYFKSNIKTFCEYIGIAIMISITGYLISGIINDSTVTVSPIYWCLIGIGLAVNRLCKAKK